MTRAVFMGIMPKFKVGDFVIDSDIVFDSESLVLIKKRRFVMEGLAVDWVYFGYEYNVEGNPINLRYKTTINARESSFTPLTSRILDP